MDEHVTGVKMFARTLPYAAVFAAIALGFQPNDPMTLEIFTKLFFLFGFSRLICLKLKLEG